MAVSRAFVPPWSVLAVPGRLHLSDQSPALRPDGTLGAPHRLV